MTLQWVSALYSLIPLLVFGSILLFFIRKAKRNPNAEISPQPADRYDQLLRLAALRDRGVLTESEFVREKYRVLGIELDLPPGHVEPSQES